MPQLGERLLSGPSTPRRQIPAMNFVNAATNAPYRRGGKGCNLAWPTFHYTGNTQRDLRSFAPRCANYPLASLLSGLFGRFRPFFLAGLLVLLLFRVLPAPVRSLPPSLSGPSLVPRAHPAPRRAPTNLRVVVAMPGGTRGRGKLGCCAKKNPRFFANSVALSLSLGRRDGLRPAARALRRRMRLLSSFLASFCSLSSRASYRVVS